MYKWITGLLIAVLIAVAAPAAVMAAALELTPSAKSAYDKMAASADRSISAKLTAQYNEHLAVQKQQADWDERIQTLHYRSEEALTLLRGQIKQIDDAKLKQLDLQVKETRKRYEPLFALYRSLNEQIAAAKPLHNKELNAMLRMQADTMKDAVQLARADIRMKEEALKKAKETAAAKMKRIRSTLAEIDPVKVRIRAEKSTASRLQKSVSPVWKGFNHAVKKNDANGALNMLASVISLSRQIAGQKQKVHALETKISDIINKAKTQIQENAI